MTPQLELDTVGSRRLGCPKPAAAIIGFPPIATTRGLAIAIGRSSSLRPPGGRSAEGDIEMTAMVDVTFGILIFSIVTVAFSLQKSIEVRPPAGQKAAQASPAR